MAARVLVATWQETGPVGCLRKLWAALMMQTPIAVAGRRTARSVGAYFDLITDDGRLFYGDGFHLGYFVAGGESLDEAVDNHTDLIARLAHVGPQASVLDVGCGVGAPALRLAGRYGCHVTGVNISREQVRQGRALIMDRGFADRVTLLRSDARTLRFPDASFDAVVCMEAAGDICVTEEDKARLVSELFRVLRPGGWLGFSDLALRSRPSDAEDQTLRAVLYHSGSELVTDWSTLLAGCGFQIGEQWDIIEETLPTWTHALGVYQRRDHEVARRYGRRLADRITAELEQIPAILARHGSFPAVSAYKP